MNEHKLKDFICEIGRRIYAKGFAAANDGNITIRLNDRQVLCTPTMVSKGYLKPDDLCVVDYEGKQLRGTRKRSSEILLHLSVYKHNPEINAVVHCHPPHATAFAVAGEPIDNCDLCGNNIIQRGYREFEPEAQAFQRDDHPCTCSTTAANGKAAAPDVDSLVRLVTDQVMAALQAAK